MHEGYLRIDSDNCVLILEYLQAIWIISNKDMGKGTFIVSKGGLYAK